MAGPILEDQEMYLKVLFEIYVEDSEKPIRTSEVAEAMGVTAASASEMLKRLGTKGFVNHVPYKGVTLNEQGIQAASRVKRREALMEVFLVQMLDFSGDIKDVACRLEHALTDELEFAIDRLLGYPKTAPDGTEIPPASRVVNADVDRLLLPLFALPNDVAATVELIIVDGTDEKTLKDVGISVGSSVKSSDGKWIIDGVEIMVGVPLQSRILVRTD
ncbi:MAG: metal-dependent transcriptional regulator [Euryarchaeota archaeon]|jgi:DtxR family Mn-dependent transcriptional regulator|nr:metal-dependent transcriptional regulator [Euryarchaeota archaeon]